MAELLGNRRTYAVVDELGVDPLRDISFDAIRSVERFTFLTIDQSIEFNLPLIADKVYRDAKWWWVILVYNDIHDAFEVKRGLRIKIPVFSDVTSALSEVTLKIPSNPKVVTI